MKPIVKIIKTLLASGVILLLTISANAQYERTYYAVEIDDVLCGYATTDMGKTEYRRQSMIELHDTARLLLKALGRDMNMQIYSRHIIHPETGLVLFNKTKLDYNTGANTEMITEVFDEYALRTELPRETPDTLWDIEGVIFDNPIASSYLIRDFVEGKASEADYRVYDYLLGDIANQKYTLLGEEDVVFAGDEYHTLHMNIYNSKTGTNTRVWVNTENGMTLRFEIMSRNIYLADESVIKKITIVDLDNTIFARVDKNISNFMDMTYMKVSADIKSAGEEVSVESLNFPGQIFKGTVLENHIQGVFEIEPLRYDGSNAPDFPTDFGGDDELKKYLEPEVFIESDHPDIITEARQITSGSKDSWEAVVRLSTWVGKEISGAVPGGTTAINTYRIREGECGSHSRLLTAFCRAAGIPSRLSIGCMYSPWYGGSFGQHAWTEVYMGSVVGWVAVDATILEFDYVDAGHIKLGEGATFQPQKMEILEYKIGGEVPTTVEGEVPAEYINIIGPYTNEGNRNVLEVLYADGGIGVDIMGRMVLALYDPDEKGHRYAKLSADVYFSFPEDENGLVDEMIIVERVYASKKSIDEPINNDSIPATLKPYIGPYVIMQIQKEFTVSCDKGKLFMLSPDAKNPRPLVATGIEGRLRDTVDSKEYSFNMNSDGSVNRMIVYITSVLAKGGTAAWIIEKAIDEEGLEAAEKKFKELWDNRAFDLEHTEDDMNNLGYNYLGAENLDAALLVFKLNVEAFPESWNVYDSYGEALLASGDTENSILNYQRSIELNPDNEGGKKALEELSNTTE
jgi:hypothetical protein